MVCRYIERLRLLFASWQCLLLVTIVNCVLAVLAMVLPKLNIPLKTFMALMVVAYIWLIISTGIQGHQNARTADQADQSIRELHHAIHVADDARALLASSVQEAHRSIERVQRSAEEAQRSIERTQRSAAKANLDIFRQDVARVRNQVVMAGFVSEVKDSEFYDSYYQIFDTLQGLESPRERIKYTRLNDMEFWDARGDHILDRIRANVSKYRAAHPRGTY
jgi:septal ring factor EnvC (AmiA/AmiB activator)